MPLREFGCGVDGMVTEVYHPSTYPKEVPPPVCVRCGAVMGLMFSVPHLDTASTFRSFSWTGPEGRTWNIGSLHELRQVEKHYDSTPYKCRFDAYSAEPSNPDAVDGFGLPQWSGEAGDTDRKSFSLPIRED